MENSTVKFYSDWYAIEVHNDGRVYARPYNVVENIQSPENGLSDLREELFPQRKVTYRDGIGTYYMSQNGTKSVVIMDDMTGIR